MRNGARLSIWPIVAALLHLAAAPCCWAQTEPARIHESDRKAADQRGRRWCKPATLIALPDAELEARKRIGALLDQQVSLDFDNQRLAEVADHLRDKLRIPVVMDWKGLEEAGQDQDTRVTFHWKNATLRSALDLMLGTHDLDWVVKREALVITSPEKSAAELEIRLYVVRDLVAVKDDDGIESEDYDSLIELITTTIAPTQWQDWSGPSPKLEYPAAHALVISQTQRVHDQVERLLANLRRARDLAEGKDHPDSATRSRRVKPRHVHGPIECRRGWQGPQVREQPSASKQP